MMRFVDLRGQHCSGNRFAFYNTVDDRFVVINNTQAWGTKSDLMSDIDALVNAELHPGFAMTLRDRLGSLMPEWTEIPEPDDVDVELNSKEG